MFVDIGEAVGYYFFVLVPSFLLLHPRKRMLNFPISLFLCFTDQQGGQLAGAEASNPETAVLSIVCVYVYKEKTSRDILFTHCIESRHLGMCVCVYIYICMYV